MPSRRENERRLKSLYRAVDAAERERQSLAHYIDAIRGRIVFYEQLIQEQREHPNRKPDGVLKTFSRGFWRKR